MQFNMHQSSDIVKNIVQRKLDHDQAAQELAPLFGLGRGVLAAQKVKCLFLYIEQTGVFNEFDRKHIDNKCDLTIPEWGPVHDLVTKYLDTPGQSNQSDQEFNIPASQDARYHYADFITAILVDTKRNVTGTSLLAWLGANDFDDNVWILFHMLLYLHLDRERCNRSLGARLMRRLTFKS